MVRTTQWSEIFKRSTYVSVTIRSKFTCGMSPSPLRFAHVSCQQTFANFKFAKFKPIKNVEQGSVKLNWNIYKSDMLLYCVLFLLMKFYSKLFLIHDTHQHTSSSARITLCFRNSLCSYPSSFSASFLSVLLSTSTLISSAHTQCFMFLVKDFHEGTFIQILHLEKSFGIVLYQVNIKYNSCKSKL